MRELEPATAAREERACRVKVDISQPYTRKQWGNGVYLVPGTARKIVVNAKDRRLVDARGGACVQDPPSRH